MFEKQEVKREYLTVTEITGLPSIPLISLDIKALLEETGQLAVLYLAIFRYEKGEEDFDWPIWDVVLKETAHILKGLQGEIFRKDDIVSTYKDSKRNLLIILSGPRTKERLEYESLKRARDRILTHLRERMEQRLGSYDFQKFGFYLGYGFGCKDPALSAAKTLDKAVDKAYQMAIEEESRERGEKTGMLKEIIAKRSIEVLFQPIIHLETREVLGYEALSRGSEKGLENPRLLFYLAHKGDLTLVLEEVCREKTILDGINREKAEKLFLNTEVELAQAEDNCLALLAKAGLRPEDVVIELDEKKAAASIPLFRQAARHFREKGFLVAVDGVDSSYESLQPVRELQPEFIKVGPSLVRFIDSDPIKRELLKTMLKVSDDLPSVMIAVGIETAKEYDTLKDLGVLYGQGYFIAAPDTKPFLRSCNA